jgi:hypothetical protein
MMMNIPSGKSAAPATSTSGSARQLHAPSGRIRVGPEKQRGVADRPDADAAAFVRDLFAQRSPLHAVGADKPQLHQLVGPQQPLQFLEEGGGDAGFADPNVVGEGLAQSTQVGTLGARERKFVHPGSVAGAWAAAKPRDFA